jgi:hypothetical protein
LDPLARLARRSYESRRAPNPTSEILYWRIHTTTPRLGPFTTEVWMHVSPDGTTDKVRELCLDGPSKGNERVFDEPYGVGDPWHGDISLDRRVGARTRTLRGQPLAVASRRNPVAGPEDRQAHPHPVGQRDDQVVAERTRGALPAPTRRRRAPGDAEVQRTQMTAWSVPNPQVETAARELNRDHRSLKLAVVNGGE